MIELHKGHQTNAIKMNPYVAIWAITGRLEEKSHTRPSRACCIEKTSGVPANNLNLLGATDTLRTPTTANAALTEKLAVAEKHITHH